MDNIKALIRYARKKGLIVEPHDTRHSVWRIRRPDAEGVILLPRQAGGYHSRYAESRRAIDKLASNIHRP